MAGISGRIGRKARSSRSDRLGLASDQLVDGVTIHVRHGVVAARDVVELLLGSGDALLHGLDLLLGVLRVLLLEAHELLLLARQLDQAQLAITLRLKDLCLQLLDAIVLLLLHAFACATRSTSHQ